MLLVSVDSKIFSKHFLKRTWCTKSNMVKSSTNTTENKFYEINWDASNYTFQNMYFQLLWSSGLMPLGADKVFTPLALIDPVLINNLQNRSDRPFQIQWWKEQKVGVICWAPILWSWVESVLFPNKLSARYAVGDKLHVLY